jgi:UDP-N-acetylglucosamine 2-epimerase (hydrolysing)
MSNSSPRTILFLTATRADFGKIKSLISILAQHPDEFEVSIAVTGMHLSAQHGNTYREIEKAFPGLRQYIFTNSGEDLGMDIALANTIVGVSSVLKRLNPDLFIIHGDRIEALAGAISGALNNIRVAHIEGGEVSGTIDELMRHATSKMAHIHFVANSDAQKLLVQLGEEPKSISIIGSPDLDLMSDNHIHPLEEALEHYAIPFEDFAVLLLHPVTTDLIETERNISEIVEFVKNCTSTNFVIIGPNNDHGSEIIWQKIKTIESLTNVRIFPSLRFEYFISLLKHAKYILGNSSAGVREAPYLGTPCINVGTRQNSRANGEMILNLEEVTLLKIISLTRKAEELPRKREASFGDGKSDIKFLEQLRSGSYLHVPLQKKFILSGN